MKVAIIGSGAREAAMAWKIACRHGKDSVVVIPGNGGTPRPDATVCHEDFQALANFCRQQRIDFIIPGGETALVNDIVGHMQKLGGPPVIGPDGHAARLEGSKKWAKEFMTRNRVATARAIVCKDIESARSACLETDRVVVKYDGLASGKGVWVCQTRQESEKALDEAEKKFGADAEIILESFLEGDELSIIGFTDGKVFRLLSPTQDHKQAFDNDQGPNTGGMGAFSPVPGCDQKLIEAIEKQIVEPTLAGLQKEKLNYIGPIFFGIMVTAEGPRLLEYNVRFGDPETQTLLPLLENDLLEIYLACLNGTLENIKIQNRPGYCVGVVLATREYPDRSDSRIDLSCLKNFQPSPETIIFHGGTFMENDRLLGAGGRLLTVASCAEELEQARLLCYQAISAISAEGTRCRSDIGCRLNPFIKSTGSQGATL
ncbi:MAG: phosphoribosylamine--glycine ligase [Candidatus Riflebacteria bacterium]